MSESKHTPGPWEGGKTTIYAASGEPVAYDVWNVADSYLIAAAPAMREALQVAEVSLGPGDFCECDDGHERMGTVCRACFALQEIRAALALARGEE